MALQWTWAGAVALPEQSRLALCVGIALDMMGVAVGATASHEPADGFLRVV